MTMTSHNSPNGVYMRISCTIIALIMTCSVFASSPPRISKDAVKMEIVKSKNNYVIELNKDANNIKISVNFESVTPKVRDNVYNGLGLVVADIERTNQTFNRVQLISIEWNNKAVLIPRTAYNQLLDVKYLYLTKDKDGAFLRIIGGDGGESYMCDLNFDHLFLRSKGIYSLGFPDENNEITSYKYNESKE